jgi:hypothetical protein
MKLNSRGMLLWLLFIAIVSISIFSVNVYLRNKPIKVEVFEGVSLGQSMEETIYALGKPNSVTDKEVTGRFGGLRVFNMEELSDLKKSPSEYLHWSYESYPKHLDIEFSKEGRVVSVWCYYHRKYENPSLTHCSVNNVGIFDSESKVFEALGEPSKVKLSEGTKILEYHNLNMILYLMRREVVALSVTKLPRNLLE